MIPFCLMLQCFEIYLPLWSCQHVGKIFLFFQKFLLLRYFWACERGFLANICFLLFSYQFAFLQILCIFGKNIYLHIWHKSSSWRDADKLFYNSIVLVFCLHPYMRSLAFREVFCYVCILGCLGLGRIGKPQGQALSLDWGLFWLATSCYTILGDSSRFSPRLHPTVCYAWVRVGLVEPGARPWLGIEACFGLNTVRGGRSKSNLNS